MFRQVFRFTLVLQVSVRVTDTIRMIQGVMVSFSLFKPMKCIIVQGCFWKVKGSVMI